MISTAIKFNTNEVNPLVKKNTTIATNPIGVEIVDATLDYIELNETLFMNHLIDNMSKIVFLPKNVYSGAYNDQVPHHIEDLLSTSKMRHRVPFNTAYSALYRLAKLKVYRMGTLYSSAYSERTPDAVLADVYIGCIPAPQSDVSDINMVGGYAGTHFINYVLAINGEIIGYYASSMTRSLEQYMDPVNLMMDRIKVEYDNKSRPVSCAITTIDLVDAQHVSNTDGMSLSIRCMGNDFWFESQYKHDPQHVVSKSLTLTTRDEKYANINRTLFNKLFGNHGIVSRIMKIGTSPITPDSSPQDEGDEVLSLYCRTYLTVFSINNENKIIYEYYVETKDGERCPVSMDYYAGDEKAEKSGIVESDDGKWVFQVVVDNPFDDSKKYAMFYTVDKETCPDAINNALKHITKKQNTNTNVVITTADVGKAVFGHYTNIHNIDFVDVQQ